MKASKGPVVPIIVIGWPENKEYKIPPNAVAPTVSTVPIAPPVAVANKPPNATAGAKQAKNKKNDDDNTLRLKPSVKSDFTWGNLTLISAANPLPNGSTNGRLLFALDDIDIDVDDDNDL